MEKLNQCIMQGQKVNRGWIDCGGYKTHLKPPSRLAPSTCVQVTKRKFKLQIRLNPPQTRAIALVPGSWPPHITCTDAVQNLRRDCAPEFSFEFARTRRLDLFEPTEEVVARSQFSVFLNFENCSAGVSSEAGSQGPGDGLTESCYV